MDLFLKRVLPVLIVLTGIGAGFWVNRRPEPVVSAAPPAPAEAARAFRPSTPPPTGAVSPDVAPSSPPAADAEAEADPSQAENAQDLWYRIAREYSPQLLARNFHFAAAEGRTLLIRQQRVTGPNPFVQITAQWYGRNDAAETVPKELLNETRFLEPNEVVELAGPAWMERVTEGGRPLMTEDAYELSSPEETVTMRNGVAYNLKVKRGLKRVVCEKDEPCRCP